MNLFGVSIQGDCCHVNGHQIEQPRWSEVWNQYPDWGPHPYPIKQLKWPWRSRGIWEVPHHDHHPSLWQGNQHLTGLRLGIVWKYRWSPPKMRVTPLPSHACQAPIVEDMVPDGKAGLTEAVMTDPGWAILFYGQQSLGEGLSLGEVQDATFMLSGATSWVGKQAQLSAKSVSLGDGQWLIAQAITEGHIKPRGPGCPCSIPPVSTPFNFHNQDFSMTSKLPSSCWTMRDAQMWPSPSKSGVRLGATVRPGLRPETMRVIGSSTLVTFIPIRSWIWKWQKFSINFLISGINVCGIERF